MSSAQDTERTMVHRIERSDLDSLLDSLRRRNYEIVGPTVRSGAIVYETLASSNDLPAGWTDEQGPATYRLRQRKDPALFAYSVGPHSWKKFLFPPVLKLFSARRNGKEFQITDGTRPDASSQSRERIEEKKYAFLGVRSCELNAIAIQDKVFGDGPYQDPHYTQLRDRLFIIAVHCTIAGANCFCASVNTGPRVPSGYDLALTEVIDEFEHYFMVEVGSERGAEVLSDLEYRPARQHEIERAERLVQEAAQNMGRSLDTTNLKDLLTQNPEYPQWEKVAARCLTCTNCTMVCPTCFCTAVEDVTDLTGEKAERIRLWDSCFTMDFSYIHGGSIRATVKSRYRQWMTHKLATWVDQFGTLGCVGCGRCITWCPVGIDITEEARAIRVYHQQHATS